MTDIVTFGSDKPPWRPPRRLVLAGAVVLALVAAGVAVLRQGDGRGSSAAAPTASTETPEPAPPQCAAAGIPVIDSPAALLIDCAAHPGGSVTSRDRTADDGAWTVVVRRTDGSLGRHGAVVTFPVAAPPSTAPRVTVGRVTGRSGPGSVTWPIAGRYARVRGDLPESVLAAIAADTSVVDRHPAVNPPAGYRVAGAGPYRPPEIHQIRYGTADLGEQAALGGGLTFTTVARGGGYEDLLYATGGRPAGPVQGHPAVVSPLFGGNGGLGWEPAPGVVAYVGYSGNELNDNAVAALQRLAGRTRPLTAGQWRATGPSIADQRNDLG